MIRMIAKSLCFAMLAATISPACAGSIDELKRDLDAIFDAPLWRHSRWGIAIMDLNSSQTLYERDADKSFMPASNMKLYTTAAAIEILGKEYRFETPIYATAKPDKRGVLKGDLIIVGSGDPSISGRYIKDKPTTAVLAEWADAVKKAGIKRITGSVIGDDDIFDDDPVAGSWQLDYFAEWYAAENSGLTMNDNCWDAIISPGAKVGEKAKITAVIPSKHFRIKNSMITTGPAEKHSDDNVRVQITRDLETNDITLSGTIPSNHGNYEEWGSIINGTLFAATMFAEELERKGIKVAGGAKDIDDLSPSQKGKAKAGRASLVHTHVSPPLPQILAIVNKPSQNFYADQLLKVLGAKTRGRGSFSAGRQAVQDFLTTAGADADSLQMRDGSGLSRQNMVQPNQTMALLVHMSKSPNAKEFEESLPIMGVDGTLKSRLQNTPAHRNVKAKTGTVNMVRSLSGYLTTDENRRIAFCMMANNYSAPVSRATEAQDQALLRLIKYRTESATATDNATTATTVGK